MYLVCCGYTCFMHKFIGEKVLRRGENLLNRRAHGSRI